jgi:DNA-binding winged helix-turn-helix (wHTH) protein
MQPPQTNAEAGAGPDRRYGSLDGSQPPKREIALVGDDAALEFGRFRVLPRRRQLLADGRPIELGTRAFDLLMLLIEARGLLVTKDEILTRVWLGSVVEESNLHVQISALRKALGEDRGLIQTEFGRGYRFTAVVRSTAAAGHGLPPAATCGERTELRDRLAMLVEVLCLGRALRSDESGEAARIVLDLETAMRLLALASLGCLMQIDRSI